MKRLLLGSGLVLSCFSAGAQAAKVPLTLYAGAGALYGAYQINHSDYKLDYVIPRAVVGLQRGRWAWEAGVAHFHPDDVFYSQQYRDYYTNQLQYSQSRSGLNSWLVPLLARYSLRAGPRKFQVEALLGLLASFSAKSWVSTTTDSNNAVVYYTDTTTHLQDYGLATGLGLRYSPVPFLALTADGQLNFYQQAYFPIALPIISAGVRYQLVR